MRPVLVLALLPALAAGAAPPSLVIVRPFISQSEDGEPDQPNSSHVPGETLYFTCRIANFTKSADSKIHVAYSVQAFDGRGTPLDQIYKNELIDEVSPQDKEWMPKIQTEIAVPPLALSGTYKIVVKAEDLLGHTTAQLDVPFEIRGHTIQAGEKLTVQNVRFFHGETDNAPMTAAVYRPGDGVWIRMDITGFGYGLGNRVDVSYVTSFLNSAGKVLWKQPEPAIEQSDSFYAKPYIPAEFGVNLDRSIQPGAYTILVQVKDAVGNQSYEIKQTFTVE